MDLIAYCRSKIKLSSEDADRIDALFLRQLYAKGEIILTPESMSQKLIFIEQGLMRMFYQKEDKDITFLFRDENSFTAPVNSIFYNKPSPYGWEALENCTVRSIRYPDMEALYSQIRSLESLERIILIESIKIVGNKLFAIQFQTAEQRYNHMIKVFPEILLRAPLGHIASYLGITQQTLSVIRGKKHV